MDERKLLKNVIDKDPSGGRLQSLKLPRDLSLGISKPKKQYAPNLNVVRNKDKTKEFLKKMNQERKGKVSHRERHDKHDTKQRYIQSSGVFSQGTGEVKRSLPSGEKRLSLRDNIGASNTIMPKINRNSWIGKNSNEAVLDDFSNSDEDSEEEKSSFKPLNLTFDFKAPFIKSEIVKKELLDDPAELATATAMRNVPEPFNNSDIYNDENPSLSLLKLPDTFAGKGLSDDNNCKKLFDYPLSGMLEGQIGKLVIRRSGKMEMQIGSMQYEVIPDITMLHKQELATVVEDGSANMSIAVLGNILNNFILSPEYDEL